MTNNRRPRNRGYSLWIVRQVEAANSELLGVRLAKFCIANDISVATVAADLGVSRQAVYRWFVGDYYPQAKMAARIETWLFDRQPAPAV